MYNTIWNMTLFYLIIIQIIEFVRPSIGPSIEIIPPWDQKIQVGGTVSVECRIAGGDPMPSLLW